MPKGSLTTTEVRSRIAAALALLQEPCTSTDRRNARLLLADTAQQLPADDVVGPLVLVAPPLADALLERARAADGADMLREVL